MFPWKDEFKWKRDRGWHIFEKLVSCINTLKCSGRNGRWYKSTNIFRNFFSSKTWQKNWFLFLPKRRWCWNWSSNDREKTSRWFFATRNKLKEIGSLWPFSLYHFQEKNGTRNKHTLLLRPSIWSHCFYHRLLLSKRDKQIGVAPSTGRFLQWMRYRNVSQYSLNETGFGGVQYICLIRSKI